MHSLYILFSYKNDRSIRLDIHLMRATVQLASSITPCILLPARFSSVPSLARPSSSVPALRAMPELLPRMVMGRGRPARPRLLLADRIARSASPLLEPGRLVCPDGMRCCAGSRRWHASAWWPRPRNPCRCGASAPPPRSIPTHSSCCPTVCSIGLSGNVPVNSTEL